MDKFIAAKYNDQLPVLTNNNDEIKVISSIPANNSQISKTVHITDNFLPLIVYWKYDHHQNCALNPSIAVINFTNAINTLAPNTLMQKLNGRKLELTVDQAPTAFSIVMKENMVWLVYAVSWSKIYIEPDMDDLIVSYKVSGGDNSKSGKIIVKSTDKNKNFRIFQSWKSATSEYLTNYNTNLTTMTQAFVNQLSNEL
ncbi:MAG: hypothetical protein PW786_00985 [Arachidicoccus sp.]|nr:hypothetical protein [Arachidicoccus sp.]